MTTTARIAGAYASAFAVANTYLMVVVFGAWPKYPAPGLLGVAYARLGALLCLPQVLSFAVLNGIERVSTPGPLGAALLLTGLSTLQYTPLTRYLLLRRAGKTAGPGYFTLLVLLLAAMLVSLAVASMLRHAGGPRFFS